MPGKVGTDVKIVDRVYFEVQLPYETRKNEINHKNPQNNRH
jgi:hypothetical protein